MADSPLILGYAQYARDTARLLNYPRVPSDWSPDQQTDVWSCLDTGLRRFLNYREWNFLRKWGTLTFTAGVDICDLADDFASPRGNGMVYAAESGRPPIYYVGESHIREMKSGFSPAWYPRVAVIEPKSQITPGTTGQRWHVHFWPAPSSTDTVWYFYNIIVSTALRSNTPYPPGGVVHAEAIRECILAAAEEMDDQIGIHHQLAEAELLKSVEKDKELGARFLPPPATVLADGRLEASPRPGTITIGGRVF